MQIVIGNVLSADDLTLVREALARTGGIPPVLPPAW